MLHNNDFFKQIFGNGISFHSMVPFRYRYETFCKATKIGDLKYLHSSKRTLKSLTCMTYQSLNILNNKFDLLHNKEYIYSKRFLKSLVT